MQLTVESVNQIVGFTPSDYQLGVFQYITDQIMAAFDRKPMQSLIVKAAAGSGKTTTAVGANKLIVHLLEQNRARLRRPLRVLFLAFNKPIQLELEERLPASVPAKTLNGLGHGALGQFTRRHCNVSRVLLNTGKTRKLLKGLLNYEDRRKMGGDIQFLVGMCKALGVAPVVAEDDAEYGLYEGLKGQTATDEVLLAICEHFRRRLDATNQPAILNYTRMVLRAGFNDPSEIDFNDQKYIPVVLSPNGAGSRIAMEQYDVIFVDEAQDVNPTDLELVRLSLREGGMVIAIGDDRQAIYGFRGADVNSINNIRTTFNAAEKPLSITYRCAKKIVEYLNTIYSGIEAAPNAPEGDVVEHGKFDHTLFQTWGPEATDKQRKTIHDMVVCRNNAPLVKIAYRLIRARVPVHMMGRDFGKDLISLIEALVGDDRKAANVYGKATVVELTEKLDAWEARQIEIMRAKDGDEAEEDKVRDRSDTIRVFISDNVDGKVQSIVDEISKLFNTNSTGNEEDKKTIPTDKIVLSSGHKSKGLEAVRVFFLDQHLLFPQWVIPGTWQEEQERNLQYVIGSRPILYLGFIDSDRMV